MYFITIEGIHEVLKEAARAKLERSIPYISNLNLINLKNTENNNKPKGIIEDLAAKSMKIQQIASKPRAGNEIAIVSSYLGFAFESLYWKRIFMMQDQNTETPLNAVLDLKTVGFDLKNEFINKLESLPIAVPNLVIVLDFPPKDIRNRMILENSEQLKPSLNSDYILKWDRVLEIRTLLIKHLFLEHPEERQSFFQGKNKALEIVFMNDLDGGAWKKLEKRISRHLVSVSNSNNNEGVTFLERR